MASEVLRHRPALVRSRTARPSGIAGRACSPGPQPRRRSSAVSRSRPVARSPHSTSRWGVAPQVVTGAAVAAGRGAHRVPVVAADHHRVTGHAVVGRPRQCRAPVTSGVGEHPHHDGGRDVGEVDEGDQGEVVGGRARGGAARRAARRPSPRPSRRRPRPRRPCRRPVRPPARLPRRRRPPRGRSRSRAPGPPPSRPTWGHRRSAAPGPWVPPSAGRPRRRGRARRCSPGRPCDGGVDEHPGRLGRAVRGLRVGVERTAGQATVEQEGERAGQAARVGRPGIRGEAGDPVRTAALWATVRSCTGVPGAASAAALMNAHPR